MVALLAAVTMTLGNLAALQQTNLKRMLAYSSIAHAGYVLMGVATMDSQGFQSVLFYLVAYYFMNLGAFGAVIYFANTTHGEEIDDLKGLGWKSPIVGAAFVVFLISLIGIPPTAGFTGKYFLFVTTIEKGYLWLAVVAGLNTAVSLFYYFRIAKALYLRPESEARFATVRSSPLFGGLLASLAVATIWFGVGPGYAWLLDYSKYSQTILLR